MFSSSALQDSRTWQETAFTNGPPSTENYGQGKQLSVRPRRHSAWSKRHFSQTPQITDISSQQPAVFQRGQPLRGTTLDQILHNGRTKQNRTQTEVESSQKLQISNSLVFQEQTLQSILKQTLKQTPENLAQAQAQLRTVSQVRNQLARAEPSHQLSQVVAVKVKKRSTTAYRSRPRGPDAPLFTLTGQDSRVIDMRNTTSLLSREKSGHHMRLPSRALTSFGGGPNVLTYQQRRQQAWDKSKSRSPPGDRTASAGGGVLGATEMKKLCEVKANFKNWLGQTESGQQSAVILDDLLKVGFFQARKNPGQGKRRSVPKSDYQSHLPVRNQQPRLNNKLNSALRQGQHSKGRPVSTNQKQSHQSMLVALEDNSINTWALNSPKSKSSNNSAALIAKKRSQYIQSGKTDQLINSADIEESKKEREDLSQLTKIFENNVIETFILNMHTSGPSNFNLSKPQKQPPTTAQETNQDQTFSIHTIIEDQEHQRSRTSKQQLTGVLSVSRSQQTDQLMQTHVTDESKKSKRKMFKNSRRLVKTGSNQTQTEQEILGNNTTIDCQKEEGDGDDKSEAKCQVSSIGQQPSVKLHSDQSVKDKNSVLDNSLSAKHGNSLKRVQSPPEEVLNIQIDSFPYEDERQSEDESLTSLQVQQRAADEMLRQEAKRKNLSPLRVQIPPLNLETIKDFHDDEQLLEEELKADGGQGQDITEVSYSESDVAPDQQASPKKASSADQRSKTSPPGAVTAEIEVEKEQAARDVKVDGDDLAMEQAYVLPSDDNSSKSNKSSSAKITSQEVAINQAERSQKTPDQTKQISDGKSSPVQVNVVKEEELPSKEDHHPNATPQDTQEPRKQTASLAQKSDELNEGAENPSPTFLIIERESTSEVHWPKPIEIRDEQIIGKMDAQANVQKPSRQESIPAPQKEDQLEIALLKVLKLVSESQIKEIQKAGGTVAAEQLIKGLLAQLAANDDLNDRAPEQPEKETQSNLIKLQQPEKPMEEEKRPKVRTAVKDGKKVSSAKAPKLNSQESLMKDGSTQLAKLFSDNSEVEPSKRPSKRPSSQPTSRTSSARGLSLQFSLPNILMSMCDSIEEVKTLNESKAISRNSQVYSLTHPNDKIKNEIAQLEGKKSKHSSFSLLHHQNLLKQSMDGSSFDDASLESSSAYDPRSQRARSRDLSSSSHSVASVFSYNSKKSQGSSSRKGRRNRRRQSRLINELFQVLNQFEGDNLRSLKKQPIPLQATRSEPKEAVVVCSSQEEIQKGEKILDNMQSELINPTLRMRGTHIDDETLNQTEQIFSEFKNLHRDFICADRSLRRLSVTSIIGNKMQKSLSDSTPHSSLKRMNSQMDLYLVRSKLGMFIKQSDESQSSYETGDFLQAKKRNSPRNAVSMPRQAAPNIFKSPANRQSMMMSAEMKRQSMRTLKTVELGAPLLAINLNSFVRQDTFKVKHVELNKISLKISVDPREAKEYQKQREQFSALVKQFQGIEEGHLQKIKTMQDLMLKRISIIMNKTVFSPLKLDINKELKKKYSILDDVIPEFGKSQANQESLPTKLSDYLVIDIENEFYGFLSKHKNKQQFFLNVSDDDKDLNYLLANLKAPDYKLIFSTEEAEKWDFSAEIFDHPILPNISSINLNRSVASMRQLKNSPDAASDVSLISESDLDQFDNDSIGSIKFKNTYINIAQKFKHFFKTQITSESKQVQEDEVIFQGTQDWGPTPPSPRSSKKILRQTVKSRPSQALLAQIQAHWITQNYVVIADRYKELQQRKHQRQEARDKLFDKQVENQIEKHGDRFKQRVHVKTASIQYYLFESRKESYIINNLRNPAQYKGLYKTLWRKSFYKVQLIYMEQQIQKQQRRHRNSSNTRRLSASKQQVAQGDSPLGSHRESQTPNLTQIRHLEHDVSGRSPATK